MLSKFRYRDAEHRTFWDHGFAYGSALAAFSQGVILGSFIQGFHVEGRHFVGSSFDSFTPFSIFTGLALVSGYALFGAGCLVIKTEGTLQDWARALGRRSLIATTLAVAVVSLWTPFIDADIAARWFSWPNIALLAPVPLMTADLIWFGWRSLNDNSSDYAPFHRRIGLVRDVLSRHRHQPVADDRARPLYPRAGRGVAKYADLPAGRNARSPTGRPALYRLIILGVSRQGAGLRRISLNNHAAGIA